MARQRYHSDDKDFQDNVKSLLLYRKIVNAKQTGNQSAEFTLDNGTVLEIEGNEGCGGCGNGWYFVGSVNACDGVITNVECKMGISDYSDVYNIFVYANNEKINALQVSGADNGYYGTGYWLTARKK